MRPPVLAGALLTLAQLMLALAEPRTDPASGSNTKMQSAESSAEQDRPSGQIADNNKQKRQDELKVGLLEEPSTTKAEQQQPLIDWANRIATLADDLESAANELELLNESSVRRKNRRSLASLISEEEEEEEATNSSEQQEEPKCRVERDLYLDFEEYKHYTCAFCYKLIPDVLFSGKLRFNKTASRVLLEDDNKGLRVWPNDTNYIRQTFKSDATFDKWRECCRQAIDCCLRNAKTLAESSIRLPDGRLIDDQRHGRCHATWDGMSCWPDTPTDTLAKHECPDHIYFFEFVPICKAQVIKQCFHNGSWYVRGDHEWSNYSNCDGLSLYATRLLMAGAWHLFSAIVIGPALIVLNRLPNRSGSKRVRILSKLLFWLLVNGLLAATQNIGIIGGFFHARKTFDDASPPPMRSLRHAPLLAATSSQLELNLDKMHSPATSNIAAADAAQLAQWDRTLDRAETHYANSTTKAQPKTTTAHVEIKHPVRRCKNCDKQQQVNSDGKLLTYLTMDFNGDNKISAQAQTKQPMSMEDVAWTDAHLDGRLSRWNSSDDQGSSAEENQLRHKRSSRTLVKYRQEQSALVVFICWIVSVGIRITRLLGYAWMFTGAVYLCSVLHFAPAEPPTLFIKWLMILTNGFPVVIGLVYIIIRTIYEPSPLTLMVRLPYYYLIGDTEYVQYLWASQLDCWVLASKLDFVEEIADLPNLVLTVLNLVLFVVTLIIMCRISGPGSTRPEMSLGDYFKAAGTLVLLYGAHYTLSFIRPPEESVSTGAASKRK